MASGYGGYGYPAMGYGMGYGISPYGMGTGMGGYTSPYQAMYMQQMMMQRAAMNNMRMNGGFNMRRP